MNWFDKILGLFGKANNTTFIVAAVFIIAMAIVFGYFDVLDRVLDCVFGKGGTP
jgi:hypothetical protein